MTPTPTDSALLARFLRQQKDFGVEEIFLDDVTRAEVLKGLREWQEASSLPATNADLPSASTDLPETSAEILKTSAEIEVLDYEGLQTVAHACERCGLAATRQHVVFSDGNPNAQLMVVGEAPGAKEDATGVPFVGQAGKMLDLLLASVDLSRKDSVYICNVLKCRPPANRNPAPDEIELCAPYLRRQISLVKPAAILAVGTFAAQLLTGHNRPLGKLRGEVYSYEGVPLIVTYHPAALLRNSGWTRATWDDFQLLRHVMDR